jgi:hypothetical protein
MQNFKNPKVHAAGKANNVILGAIARKRASRRAWAARPEISMSRKNSDARKLTFFGVLIFAKLALPAKSSRFGGDLLGLGNQPFLLVED